MTLINLNSLCEGRVKATKVVNTYTNKYGNLERFSFFELGKHPFIC